MGEMREFWANVYGPPGWPTVSVVPHATREEAAKYGEGVRSGCVHVRLKPEGAPKRYASRDNQRAWEANTEGCTRMVLLGFPGEALV